MSTRKIIKIDADKCNGCGLCVSACHEGALQLIDGKAVLVSESYCDGLGACLPECPTGALTIEERAAAPFDEAAVQQRQETHAPPHAPPPPRQDFAPPAGGCPGRMARLLERAAKAPSAATAPAPATGPAESELRQWPCQIKLVPVNAPWFDDCRLLVAADCTAYAYANMHADFMRGRITLIGCPKLDAGDYAEKLTAILAAHNIRDLTVLRMEVPCCGGLVEAVKRALTASGRIVPWQVVTIGTDGALQQP
jgi:NAD-dependent dihydropyrimidine dehydrogenase PreA subunit